MVENKIKSRKGKGILGLQKWIFQNQTEFILLILILVGGAFFRLYRISEYMTFLGDEGRDAIIARNLLLGDLVFVGPGTSIGNMYLGPFYYYLMAPALWLANFNPVGPSILVALFGVATIFLIWFIAKKWFGGWAGVVAAGLYAISPVVIIFSKHSWNPNIMPFFALLTVYSLWKVWSEKKWSWFLLTAITFGMVLQSHYLGFLLLPLIFVFWLSAFIKSFKSPLKKAALFNSLGFLLLFVLLMSPLILFDIKHNLRNLLSMQDFIFGRSSGLSFNPLLFLQRIYPTWQLLMTRLLAGKDVVVGGILATVTIVSSAYVFYRNYRKNLTGLTQKAVIILISWLVIGIIGLSFFSQDLYDHYFGFLFPAPFLLAGCLVQFGLIKTKAWGKFLAVIAGGAIIIINLLNSPLFTAPGRQMHNTIEVAQKIREEAGEDRFNFAVIAERNYEGAYQYFLELWGTKIVMINPQKYEDTLADQLFVVCEYADKTQCQPASNPKAEIANFGWSKIEKQWNVDGVVLFKMVHNWPRD